MVKKAQSGTNAAAGNVGLIGTATSFTIGGQCNLTGYHLALPADIASFKIYKGVKTQAETAALYSSSADRYIEAAHTIKFTDSDGKEIDYLDDMTSVVVNYETAANYSGTTDLFVAYYDSDGRMLDALPYYQIAGDKEVTLDIILNTAKIKVFAFESGELVPLCEEGEIAFSDGYDPHRISLTAGFYNSEGKETKYIEGQSGFYASAQLSSFMPPDNVKAKLSCVSGSTVAFQQEKEIVFEQNGTAIVKISLPENISLTEAHTLKFEIYDEEKEYFSKTIGYEDPSKTVDVLFITGQSNAEGVGGNSSQAIATELGTVYYDTITEGQTTTKRAGCDSALAKTWHDITGHTVLVVKAAWGGTGFPSLVEGTKLSSDTYGYWNPGNNGSTTTDTRPYNCFERARSIYNNAIASIDREKYTIGDCVYFWHQGENERGQYTPAQYEKAFLEVHEKFVTEFGTEDTRLQCGGIFPTRSSYNAADLPNLKLDGSRIAHYKLAREHEDLIIASDATEHWYSDSAILSWFEKKYEGVEYPASTLPNEWIDVMNADNVHYQQIAQNELGREAAENMLNYLKGGKESKKLALITPDGIRHYADGDSIYLTEDAVIPMIPADCGIKATYTISGNGAVIDDNGLISATEALLNDYATLTVTQTGKDPMTFRIYPPQTDDTITIAPIKENKSAIYTLSTDDGFAYTNKYLDSKLREQGLVGSMALVPSYMGTTVGDRVYLTWAEAEELINAEDSVWDVANHTKTHNQNQFQTLTAEQLEEEIDGGKTVLREHFPNEKVVSLVTPGGLSSTLIKNKAKENHLLLRWAGGGLNSLPATENSLLECRAYGVGGFTNITTAEQMNAWVDEAIANGSWLVEMWHGVGDDGSSTKINIEETEADAHLEYVVQKKALGDLWVATLDEVATYTMQRIKSRLSMKENNSIGMEFSLTDELSDFVYDNELTLNIILPDGVSTISSITQGDENIPYKFESGVVEVTVKPDDETVKIIY